MKWSAIGEYLKASYDRPEVWFAFEMYHPTSIDQEPELDYSSMENFERSRADRAEFHLARYEWEYHRAHQGKGK